MESLNNSIENALHFIAVIQDACDKKRLAIERANFQGYDSFVKEWKSEKTPKPPKISEPVLVEKIADEAAILEEDMEELALVDKLLEKARNIRLKTKNSLKKVDTKVILCGRELSNNTLKPSTVETQRHNTCSKKTTEPSLNERPVHRSKSATISTKLKTSNVPRSKSANVQHIPNGDQKRMHRTSAKPISRNGRTMPPNGHSSEDVSTVVLSSTEFGEFKNICSDKRFCKKKSLLHRQSTEKIHSNSDLKQCPEKQTVFPSYRKFLKERQRIAVSKSPFRIQVHGLWYPFLSLKNKSLLLDQPNIVSLSSFTKALKLVHQIQETMLWIDLLSLIARDTIPKLTLLDETDWNVIRLCSYLESIYCENLQRKPILDPN